MFTLSSQLDVFLKRIASKCARGKDFGSFSPSMYDTAWLSMIEHPHDKANKWLFPESFDFMLRNQSEDGSWESYASQVDGILNTASALLSLQKHLKGCPDHPHRHDWTFRSLNAQVALGKLLRNWNVLSSEQVGFEILVMKHLCFLEHEGISFQFHGYDKLRALYDDKLKRLPLNSVLETRSTLCHSLESLIGHINFDQVSRWQEEDGSMLGSPSSTAAYLIHASVWDTKAETYLKKVLKFGTGYGNGSAPCAWPTSVFETAWAVTTLVAAGVPIREPEASTIGSFLEEALQRGGGKVGFSLTSLPDADDTAKTMIALQHFNNHIDIRPLIQAFETEDHFSTYSGERNPSFSANCNVLICILSQKNLSPYMSQITKATKFLCSKVVSGNVREKWHIHELYWMMLFSQAFGLLYDRVLDGTLNQEAFDPVLRNQIPLVSVKILVRTMHLQRNDGSWDGICETTAYAVLTLSWLFRLPWCRQIFSEEIMSRIHNGKRFLHSHRDRWAIGNYLWIEKTTYASNILAESYCLAAVFVSIDVHAQCQLGAFHPFTSGLLDPSLRAMRKAKELLRRVPLFCGVSPQVLNAAEFLACHELNNLHEHRLEIFPRTGMGEDRYLTFIPLTWMACDILQGGPMCHSVLREMTFLSMLNYQLDEYMEIVIENKFKGDLNAVKRVIYELCSGIDKTSLKENGDNRDGHAGTSASVQHGDSELLKDIEATLRKYVGCILQHPKVLSRPLRERANLASELQTFLLAHVTHAKDNHRFFGRHTASPGSRAISSDAARSTRRCALPVQWTNPGRTFYSWVRSTSADHTSCPFSWAFFNCLIAETCGSIYATAATSYVAEDVGRHLASLCRMYNDYGSISRDRDEGNLNSINFPEFHLDLGDMESDADIETAVRNVKEELMSIAEYERRALNAAVAELAAQLGKGQLLNAVRLFVNVTDLYGQIYVVKDIATRKQ
ncbi:Ent-kaurene synthase [Hypoxylon sp. FL0543]|nr:Ent-kaurene synthase [Hypoxylon sp. FL0543]